MTMICKTCRHENRAEIEVDIARGVPLRVIALTYSVGYDSLRRHKRDHMLMETTENGANIVWTLQNVIDIPRSFKERTEMLNALLEKALEPLGTPSGTLSDVPLGFLIGLFKLQQADEQTILKITSAMPDDSVGADLIVSEQFARIKDMLEERLLLIGHGDYGKVAQAREALAEALMPMSEIESLSNRAFSHTDYELGDAVGGEDHDCNHAQS